MVTEESFIELILRATTKVVCIKGLFLPIAYYHRTTLVFWYIFGDGCSLRLLVKRWYNEYPHFGRDHTLRRAHKKAWQVNIASYHTWDSIDGVGVANYSSGQRVLKSVSGKSLIPGDTYKIFRTYVVVASWNKDMVKHEKELIIL